jgi:hypothetical protein
MCNVRSVDAVIAGLTPASVGAHAGEL